MRLAVALLITATALPLTTVASEADARIVTHPEGCVEGMRKSVNLSINFNGQEKSLAEARAAIDNSKKTLEQSAGKAGVALEANNYNYNISVSTNYNNGQPSTIYTYNGSMNYRLDNEEVAKKLTERLDEQKRQFSMNVNASKCSQ